MDEKEFQNIVQKACPGAGAGGMYTANTMASAIEALGMALPFNSSNPATGKEKKEEAIEAGKAIRLLLEKDIKPSDIITKKSLEMPLDLLQFLEVQQMLYCTFWPLQELPILSLHYKIFNV